MAERAAVKIVQLLKVWLVITVEPDSSNVRLNTTGAEVELILKHLDTSIARKALPFILIYVNSSTITETITATLTTHFMS